MTLESFKRVSVKAVLFAEMLLGGVVGSVQSAGAQEWMKTTAPDSSWKSVASSSDGSRLIAAISPFVYVSTNAGATWMQKLPIAATWPSVAVACSANGIFFVAYERDVIAVSTNAGATWTSGRTFERWSSIATSGDGSKAVATTSAPGWIYTSTNFGKTWTRMLTSTEDWSSVSSSADGTRLATASRTGPIYTSVDSGGTWTLSGAPSNSWSSIACSADGTHLVAVAGSKTNIGGIYVSADSGATWIQTGAPLRKWVSAASSADGTHLVAATFTQDIYISTNSGASWIATTIPSDYGISVGTSADGSKLVAAASVGGIYLWPATAPQLIASLQNQSHPAGAEAIFEVKAIGQSPIHYQWRFNGADLPGQTNPVLDLPNVQADQAGTYEVIVANALGTLSSNVTLVVRPPEAFTVVHNFTGHIISLTFSGNKFYGCTSEGIFSINLDGTGYTWLRDLVAFKLVPCGNRLYGITLRGSSSHEQNGTVFSMDTDGTSFSVLHNFTTAANGFAVSPYGLTLGNDTLYGTTSSGGTNNRGTVFAINTNGSGFKVLHDFAATNGGPTDLVLSGENLYGTSATDYSESGIVYTIKTNGADFNVLHRFGNPSGEGNAPGFSVVLAGNRLYGTTKSGGAQNHGTIFALMTDGTAFTVLYHFPSGFLATKGMLGLAGDAIYGMSEFSGGYSAIGTLFAVSTNGTAFSILRNFDTGGIMWSRVWPGVVLDNNLYAITFTDGYWKGGTLYRYQLSPTVTVSRLVSQPDGNITVQGTGYPGCAYLIQAATNLTPPVLWETISTTVADTNGVWQFIDTNDRAVRFYRAATP